MKINNISYDLEEYGWSTCRINTNHKPYVISITHCFPSQDPIVDCMNCLVLMARGQNKSQFKWYEEPGIHRITFQEIPSEKHKVEFIIDSSSEDYGTVIDNYDEVFRCAIPKKLLATMFYYEFKKISALLKDKNYSKNREFPFKEFTLFEKEILEYIN